jgi:MFS family permease
MVLLKDLLTRSKVFFIAWCIVAAFGTYFCMYAFRKPFNAGTYEAYTLWGFHYKIVLIVAQVLGYMCSKWIGIKIISELKAASRQTLIVGLILFAEAALVLFGLGPAPYNLVFLFFNGLPLGMVWGVIFSYLEGRKFTEVLGMGLSISLIVSSGFLKTIYFQIHDLFPGLTEFWLPAIIGLAFLPAFLFFSWMLSIIPEPSETDKLLRSERVPMNNADKQLVMKNYGPGVLAFVLIYLLLATMRDLRDNFSVEIWNEIEPGWNGTIFSKTETISGLIVLLSVGSLSLIRSNLKGFEAIQGMIAFGLLICGISTLLFGNGLISPFAWMLVLGVGMFLAYTPIQVALFERLIALFRIKANAGFFVYICDACGYMGSVVLLLYKEFFMKELSWSSVLMQFSYFLTALGLVSLICAYFFFHKKMDKSLREKMNIPEKIRLDRTVLPTK